MTIIEKNHHLTKAQLEAVNHTKGPVLVVAGPGSGKTRVLAHRIANLINNHDVLAENLLAVTFTNKAAQEMRDRCQNLLQSAFSLNIYTFHSLSSFLLRSYGSHIGIDSNFSIIDSNDQLRIIKRILKSLDKDPKLLPFKINTLISEISLAKNFKLSPSQYIKKFGNQDSLGGFYQNIFEMYEYYEDELKRSNTLDFDDLLLKTVTLLQNHEETRSICESKFKYLLVDEFQDTNKLQFEISTALTKDNKNLFVVGDPDQSIYSWRHADPNNVIDFDNFFTNAKVIRLDQNYRSTKSILSAADSLIANNNIRFDRELWTDNPEGSFVQIVTCLNPPNEASFVSEQVLKLLSEGFSEEQIAIMYRVNAQSRNIEDSFQQLKIPHRLIGATSFRERREIKDILAYVSILVNPKDENSLLRIINTPRRGITDSTFNYLKQIFLNESKYDSVIQVILDNNSSSLNGLSTRAKKSVQNFSEILSDLLTQVNNKNPDILISNILDTVKYKEYIENDTDWENRWRNIEELKIKAKEIINPNLDCLQNSLEFLSRFSLISKTDDLDNEIGIKESDNQKKVTLITLHQAKGLEFDVVFILGLEQGILPHVRSYDDPSQMEEERRLCYVGITRAKKHLYLSKCLQRIPWSEIGKQPFPQSQIQSQFISEIPDKVIEQKSFRIRGKYLNRNNPSVKKKFDMLESKINSQNNESSKILFNPSDVVIHKIFGKGIVISVEKSSGDEELIIKFDNISSPKRIIPSFGSLNKSK
ncbi:MAG: hypothetical protein CL764_05850 [Chloroflexi bacterium]|nr:hypothetical protein [Chloroflexota bacterium]